MSPLEYKLNDNYKSKTFMAANLTIWKCAQLQIHYLDAPDIFVLPGNGTWISK
jgi:hypothetical protein